MCCLCDPFLLSTPQRGVRRQGDGASLSVGDAASPWASWRQPSWLFPALMEPRRHCSWACRKPGEGAGRGK